MTDTSIYRDISGRTGGDIYIGVVGPVRSGKSTFIKKFMESLVIPNIKNDFDRERSRDELPQSAGGRAVMTTEPKFIPNEGIDVSFGDEVSARVKLIDCVGYMIPDATGGGDGGESRMVHTPWHDEPVPFEEAAEFGTRKVIRDHSTVGILVTTDGTIGDIPRENYVHAEGRVSAELDLIGKPYVIVLNSADPSSEAAVSLAMELERKYSAPVALVNVTELNAEDIWHIFGMLLEEFPAKEADIILPPWTAVLSPEHPLKRSIRDAVVRSSKTMSRLRDIREKFSVSLENALDEIVAEFGDYGRGASVSVGRVDAGNGSATIDVQLPDGLYFDIISEMTGISMKNETELLAALGDLSEAKKELDRYRDAIRDVNETGYGIVMPDERSLSLEEPEIIRQAGGYGVKLRASASSIHMIKTNIDTEINPIVGTEAQSEEMVNFLMKEFEDDPSSIWDSNMFGRSLYELVNDGLRSKLEHLPEDARTKFAETLSKVINDGSQGLICIIL